MRTTAKNIADFLNRELRVGKIHDASVNGLQVKFKKDKDVRIVGFAVDGCISTFEKAKKLHVDLIVVHHGIKWKPQKDRETAERRAEYLLMNNLALYAAHLPLDLHPRYGNNAELCRLLDLRDVRKFGRYHGTKIGYQGAFIKAVKPGDISRILNRRLKTRCCVHEFGRGKINTIGIVSGGGGGSLKEAVKERLDCLLTGDIDLAVYNTAREYGMHIIVGGHYATETPGVRALMPLIQAHFPVETVFIDDPKDL